MNTDPVTVKRERCLSMDNLSTVDKKSHKSDKSDNQLLSNSKILSSKASSSKILINENRENNHYTPEKAESIQEKPADKVIFESDLTKELIKSSSTQKETRIEDPNDHVTPFKNEIPVLDIVKNACYEIPPCLKILTGTFKIIEKSINFLKICSKTPYFNAIQDYSKKYLRSEVQENDLFRIMSICPDIYTHSYELNENTHDYELYVNHIAHTSKLTTQISKDTKAESMFDQKNSVKAPQLQKSNSVFFQDKRMYLWNEAIYKYLLEKHEDFLIEKKIRNEMEPSAF